MLTSLDVIRVRYAGSRESDKNMFGVATSESLYFSFDLLKQRLAVQSSSKGAETKLMLLTAVLNYFNDAGIFAFMYSHSVFYGTLPTDGL
jgi:hypothetical protein